MGDLIPVAGGQAGWGGYVNRGDRFIAPNEASDCLNVYEEGGVLKKRQGYTANSGALILGGEYTATSTGTQTVDSTNTKASQEVYLAGAGSGADEDFTGAAADIVIAFAIENSLAYGTSTFKFSIYSVDGSGHPNALLATQAYFSLDGIPNSESWIYATFPNVTLSSANLCLVIEEKSGTGDIKWHYSNGSGGYAPGGARVSSYWNGAAWTDIAGTDFKFKFYYRITSQNNKNIFQYFDLTSKSQYDETCSFAQNRPYGGVPVTISLEEYTAFLEDDDQILKITSLNTTNQAATFIPPYANVGKASYYVRFLKTRILLGTENYLFETAYNDWPLRIANFTTANNYYRFANTPDGLAIAPDQNAPQIWGSSSYPISGYTGAFSFAGLTNPITKAATVMWHGSRCWWGNVTINSVDYPDRAYYSEIGLLESGYSDTGYISLDGIFSAMLDLGEYAILSDHNDTYVLLGGNGPASGMERIKHDVSGGVFQQEALAIYRDNNGNCAVYGWGAKGIFEIKRTQKRYIHSKIIAEFNNYIIGDISVCPDYRRGLCLFSYTKAGVRKVLAYNVAKEIWWLEDISALQLIPIEFPLDLASRVYGIKGAEWWMTYTGNEDDTAFIEGYHKNGPAYANGGAQFTNQAIWMKTRNEPNVSHLDVKYSNDYATEVFDSSTQRRSLRKSTFADNVPVLRKVNASGAAASTEINLYQNKISTTVNVDSNSGQTVLSVADVTGFEAGHKIRINTGGAREETAVISSVGASSLTLTANLTYTHTAAQADTVYTYDESFAVSELYVEVVKGTQILEQDI